ncbi:uncharacterized protein JCM6883_006815 [Sporobolomyces salmoneus]|uniref:uncharacterized protein n=1 Tax=Sporobolomyces salmoneus TaxID=183962 RepID=UPI00316D39A1
MADPHSKTPGFNPLAGAYNDEQFTRIPTPGPYGITQSSRNSSEPGLLQTLGELSGVDNGPPPGHPDYSLHPQGSHSHSHSRSHSVSQQSSGPRRAASQRSSLKPAGLTPEGRSRASSAASRWSHVVDAPDFGYEAPENRSSGEQENLWQLGKDTLASWKESSKALIKPGCDLDAISAFVVKFTREKEVNSVAEYILRRLTVKKEMLQPPSEALGWPHSNKRPDPDLPLSSQTKQVVRFEWLGHQTLQIFARVEEIGEDSGIAENSILTEQQRLWLFMLFVLDVFAQSNITALQADWSEDLWNRLDDRYNKFGENRGIAAYEFAYEFIRRIKLNKAEHMAEEVERWVEDQIKTSKIDRKILPKGEISSRILRIWTKLHNALEPTDLWELALPPSENPRVSGIRRRMTNGLKRVGTLRNRRVSTNAPQEVEENGPHEVNARKSTERGTVQVLRNLFGRGDDSRRDGSRRRSGAA